MSMTPEEAKAFVCPVRGSGPSHDRGDPMEVTLIRNLNCIGPACMWWIPDPLHNPSGECAVTTMVGWLVAINAEQP